jgi:DNA-binding Lrp family transcriptional regulator
MKENLPKLDLKDRRILIELDKNARQTISEIAKKVGLNKNTVNYKIKRMTDEGIITGHWTFINPFRLGYFMMRVYLKFFNTTENQEKSMINWLMNHKISGVVAKVETTYDLAFMTFVKNIHEWEEFWKEFKEKFRKNFWEEKVHIFSGVRYYKRNYLQAKKEDYNFSYETIGGTEIAEYDELDMKILRLLAKSARMPIVEIAEIIKTPEKTVAFRIKQMETKKIIQGYRVNLNLDKIGYEYYKLNFFMNDLFNHKELLNFCENNPNVIYIDETLAEFDFEIDVEVKSREELLNLIKEIKKNFKVRDMQVMNFKEYLKLESIPRG